MVESILQRATEELRRLPFVTGVVLGGSRATGTAGEDSDVDIGLYYCREALDLDSLNAAAARLDDQHRKNLVCREGEWGNWVNCGGWLAMEGMPVDLILRDTARVKQVVEATDEGRFSAHYQTGHPHAFLDAAYRGELAVCRPLFAREELRELKGRAEIYPEPLQKGLMNFFGFEMEFSAMLAEKNQGKGDTAYLMGLCYRSVSAMNQALFARNRAWCLNEKKATLRVNDFPSAPKDYARRTEDLFARLAAEPEKTVALLRSLCGEAAALCQAD